MSNQAHFFLRRKKKGKKCNGNTSTLPRNWEAEIMITAKPDKEHSLINLCDVSVTNPERP